MSRVRIRRLFRLGQIIYQPGEEHEMKKQDAEKLEKMGFVEIVNKGKKDKGDRDAPSTDD